jgi:hypothetical protein
MIFFLNLGALPPGKYVAPVLTVQEAWWTPGPVGTGVQKRKSLLPESSNPWRVTIPTTISCAP